MKFSSKVLKCGLSPMRKFHPYAVAAEAKGRKIYHLNIGQPDIETPKAFFDAVRSFDLPVSIVRPFNTYGPRQSGRAIIPTIITQLLAGRTEIRLGSLAPTRDFNYVKDTAAGFMAIADCDAAVGQETEDVQGGIEPLALVDGAHQSRVLEEIAVLDCFCDSGQLLVYNAACAHVQMAYLRVTHLSVRKTYSKSAGLSFYVRALAHQLVHNRSFRFADSVMLAFVIQSISVKNH